MRQVFELTCVPRQRGADRLELDPVPLEEPVEHPFDESLAGAEVVRRGAGRHTGDGIHAAVGEGAQSFGPHEFDCGVEDGGAFVGHERHSTRITTGVVTVHYTRSTVMT